MKIRPIRVEQADRQDEANASAPGNNRCYSPNDYKQLRSHCGYVVFDEQ
jgi:hypothetical protein